jgi:hypothetical protein
MESISVELEARNSSLNCRNSLHIYNDCDLFGQVQAQVAFGREDAPAAPGGAPRRRGGVVSASTASGSAMEDGYWTSGIFA